MENVKMWEGSRCSLSQVKGVPLLEPTVQNWALVENFRARSDDLLIATYPKAGTTWTQEIVDLILNDGDAEKCRRAPTHKRMPFLEMFPLVSLESGVSDLDKMPSPRVIKTHLPIQLVPQSFWDNNCKVIYMARNAKDSVVSYFHFDRMNRIQPDPGPWDQYLHKFMHGQLGWGYWYDHVKGYWREKETKRILYLLYEDMKENPRDEVIRVMRFLERSLPDDIINRIVELTSFSVMKENPMANSSTVPYSVFDRSVSTFMRKGEVGDWQNHFSPEESRLFDEHYEKMMSGTSIPFRSQL
ncbi:sulfotransferase 1 family member D1-like [Polyodon spathula]|uniref:sulfotransferase 1 family member D1-like n=1 Tax=Polyodon spathula TaxID=7913 RepID=UPI001B7F7862|nr:sulfotransferase 1 family member D1-like [Polyodon spathula]XP_041129031.1 sulfotransferase 1 family member D1-like [Polyodon spathula]